MEVESTDSEHDHNPAMQNGPSTLMDQLVDSFPVGGDGGGGSVSQSPQMQPPVVVQQSTVIGPRPAQSYSVVNALLEKKEDGRESRCGHTSTAVTAVGEEGMPGNIGPRLILFGGATALEGNSATLGTPSSAGSAGITAGIARSFAAVARGHEMARQLKKVTVSFNPEGGVIMPPSLTEKGASRWNNALIGVVLGRRIPLKVIEQNV